MTSQLAPRTRAVYRSILRELPRRQLNHASPLQTRIRQFLSSGDAAESVSRARLEEAQQFTEYARAQATYTTLLERYNPGADMDEQERVRLTARRVGMNLPAEFEAEGDGNGNGNAER